MEHAGELLEYGSAIPSPPNKYERLCQRFIFWGAVGVMTPVLSIPLALLLDAWYFRNATSADFLRSLMVANLVTGTLGLYTSYCCIERLRCHPIYRFPWLFATLGVLINGSYVVGASLLLFLA